MYINRLSAALGAAVLAFSLTACGDSTEESSSPDAASDSSPSARSADLDSASLTMADPWAKAAKSGMTAVFGTLLNDGSDDITVVSATSEITSAMELHETVQNGDGAMAMQPKEGGFTIPAGGEHELTPGGDHLMIMDLNRALKPGEMVTIKLTLSDESTTEIDATVKRFSGADEKYQNDDMEM